MPDYLQDLFGDPLLPSYLIGAVKVFVLFGGGVLAGMWLAG